MTRIAVVFPGQGSQAVGMGKDLLQAHPAARRVFEEADRVLGVELGRVILEGPETELNRTDVAQPALLTAEIAAWSAVKETWRVPEADCLAAGHSLGEYSAWVAAGTLTFADALKLVQLRGRLMLEAARLSGGGMSALLGVDAEGAERLCREADSGGGVQVANYNCPGQIVVSGTSAALEQVAVLAAERKAKVIPLKVSGPFHSRQMQAAADGLAKALEGFEIRPPVFPVINNVTAKPVSDPEQIRRGLIEQVAGSVRWENSMREAVSLGVSEMLEVGPGKVLRGLMKKIDPAVKLHGGFEPAEISVLGAALNWEPVLAG